MHGNALILIIAFCGTLALLAIVIGVMSRRSAVPRSDINRLLQLGQEAQATVLSMQAHGRAGASSRRVKLKLEVTPPGRPSYEAKLTETLPEASIGELQPGAEVTVIYDTSRPRYVTLADWRTEPVQGLGGVRPTGPWSAINLSTKQRLVVIMMVVMGLLAVAGVAAAVFFSGYSDVLDETATPLSDLEQELDKGPYGSYEMVQASVTDPFIPPQDTVFQPSPGNRWVLVTLTVRNTDHEAIDLSWAYMQLRADDGVIYAPVVVLENPNGFRASGLAPGARYTGDLAFELPKGARPLTVQDSFRDYELPLSAAASAETPGAAT